MEKIMPQSNYEDEGKEEEYSVVAGKINNGILLSNLIFLFGYICYFPLLCWGLNFSFFPLFVFWVGLGSVSN